MSLYDYLLFCHQCFYLKVPVLGSWIVAFFLIVDFCVFNS